MTKTKLFLRSLIISATTVGGGFVIISVVRALYVEKLKLLTEEEMLEMTSLAQSSPGAVAINLSVVLGYKLCGISGAAIAVLGTFIPPLVIMSLVAAVYGMLGEFRNLEIVANIMTGMQTGVSAVVLDAALGMTVTVFREKNVLRCAVFFIAMVLQLCFSVSSVYIILGAVLVGIVSFVISAVGGKNAVHRAVFKLYHDRRAQLRRWLRHALAD